MVDKKKNTSDHAQRQVDFALEDLLKPLSEALGQMISGLDGYKGQDIDTDRTFETSRGPVRAQSGLRIKVGGLPIPTSAKRPAVTPINTNRPTPAEAKSPASNRSFAYEVFEIDNGWLLTADLPGVTHDELTFTKTNRTLTITSTEKTRYQTEVSLGDDFDTANISVELRNGILELRIPRSNGGEALS